MHSKQIDYDSFDDFIAKQQFTLLKLNKEPSNSFLAICDFTKNYPFAIQDAAAAFQWNNNQATVFPVVIF